ncbi:MAG: hypothetical protein Kow0068_19620 [Marinilabiliales bacterium]
MPQKKQIIIFCQSPADVQYALMIYDNNVHNATISIFCINVEKNYKFLKSLKLNLNQLIYISYSKNFSIKKPFSIYKEKKRLKEIYIKYFKNLENNDVYFFSHIYDWVMYSILSKIYNKNNLYLIDSYGYTEKTHLLKNSIKEIIILLIYKYITGAFLKFYVISSNNKMIGISLNSMKVTKTTIPLNLITVWNKYQYNIKIENNSILFFESSSDNESIVNYKEKIIEFLNELKNNNIHIYIKPHPRIGYSKFLKEFTSIIPDYIPGEFLPVHKFKGIIGISTVAIAKLSRHYNNVFSLINFFDYKENNKKQYYQEYLLEQSDYKIKIIDKKETLINFIINNST